MNTQQLESFIKVADNLNFARAAEALNITQSAVSRQIHSLEEELGTRLLHRSTRNVSLTPAGISFLNDAKEILAKLQLASLKIKSHSKSNIEIVSIGFVNDSYLSFITGLLRNLKELFPEVHPFLRIIPSRAILNLFIHGELDILFGFRDDIPMCNGVRYTELAQIPICCALPPNHPLADQSEIKVNELLSENIIICNSYEIPAKAASFQNQLNHQLPPDSTNYCESLHAMFCLIKAGYGIGILPEIPSENREITYVPLAETSLLSYGVFYKDTSKNPTSKKFLGLIKNSKANSKRTAQTF